MTDFLRYTIEATYLRGDPGERFATTLHVGASSIELAKAEVLQLLGQLGAIDPKVIDARPLYLPARQVEFVGVPVASLSRLFASDLVDPS